MAQISPGDRVRVTGLMPNDPCPIEIGSTGTITDVNIFDQIMVDWDSGRSLILLTTDPFEVIGNTIQELP